MRQQAITLAWTMNEKHEEHVIAPAKEQIWGNEVLPQFELNDMYETSNGCSGLGRGTNYAMRNCPSFDSMDVDKLQEQLSNWILFETKEGKYFSGKTCEG